MLTRRICLVRYCIKAQKEKLPDWEWLDVVSMEREELEIYKEYLQEL